MQPVMQRIRRFPENCFAVAAFLISLTLIVRGSVESAMMAVVWGTVYIFCVAASRPEGRPRILVNYVAALSAYSLSGHVIDAIRIPERSAELLELDRILFGESLAIKFQWFSVAWLNELLSLSYLSYHVYLHWLLWEALTRPGTAITAASRCVYGAFAVGLPLYLLLPAPSICISFPEMFTSPVSGYWATRTTIWIVGNWAAKYDSFPSLHVFIMGTMIWFDPDRGGWRRKIMIPAYFLMVASTILLRFHYGVDLVCGAILLTIYIILIDCGTLGGETA